MLLVATYLLLRDQPIKKVNVPRLGLMGIEISSQQVVKLVARFMICAKHFHLIRVVSVPGAPHSPANPEIRVVSLHRRPANPALRTKGMFARPTLRFLPTDSCVRWDLSVQGGQRAPRAPKTSLPLAIGIALLRQLGPAWATPPTCPPHPAPWTAAATRGSSRAHTVMTQERWPCRSA